jgi:lipopolysaccharide biosynthesis glycosyltransferase
MKKSLLVTLANEKYLDQAKQLFSSAYWNGGWKGDYMLLAHEIPESKLKWFKEKGILIKKCRPLDSPDMRLSKFYIFTEELKKWKNIVFLDSDIIVIASLEDLSKVKGFYAVQDLLPKIKDQFQFKYKDKQLYNNLKAKYKIKEPLFNSGVMALSTDIITKKDFSILKTLSIYQKISHPGEQGILNLLFYKQWKMLPSAYNFNPFMLKHPFLTKKDPKIKGIVLHFPGSRKPWNSKYSFYYRLWEKNLKKAESINLKKPINQAINYSEEKIINISKKINIRLFFYSPINYLDKLIGIIGIALKKTCPRIYIKSKKILSRLINGS